MIISIWRYSHLALAITSFVFVFLATITGIVLAFQPISEQIQPFKIDGIEQLNVEQTVATFKKQYPEIITIEVDANQFVSASVITKDGESLNGYFNPKTAAFLGEKPEVSNLFKFTTNLHRSLFLKGVGRFFVGLGSFLLFLIAFTGSILIIKRQSGIKKFFSKVVNEDFAQYWHVILGRLSLIPIIIITLTGVYLSLLKFDIIQEKKEKHNINFETITEAEIKPETSVFKTTALNHVETLEFPFSDDEEDYFTLKLKNKELLVHQYSGKVLSEVKNPLVTFLSNWSLVLHTGKGSILWSVILLIACINILFFIYSGFKMTIDRRKKTVIPKNKFNKDNADIIILVGSETGSTYHLATAFFKGLLDKGNRVFISDLNSYTSYKSATQLIVLTSTYGEGEAPLNAKKFLTLLQSVKQERLIHYAVVGFGSLQYPEYCKYAQLVDANLQVHSQFQPNMELFKIHNQSELEFKNWATKWNNIVASGLDVTNLKVSNKPRKEQVFTVVNKTDVNIDNTFLITLKPNKKLKFKSGDLLSVIPEKDKIERLYSIGKIDGNIVISVKKHEFGVCSNYFYNLKSNTQIKAVINHNPSFNLPKNVHNAVFIANGTGIGPFLGMMQHSKPVTKHLFWGGRTQQSLSLYKSIIDGSLKSHTLTSFNVALSQDTSDKIYVQDILEKQHTIIAEVLKTKGVIMICGSIAMQNQVLEVLNTITTETLHLPLSVFEQNNQILTDCY
ncbi:PepSY domain-containing protein [Lacinutrix sp. MedPE-SW]|uniref:PepSY domain-containing protein n=1 Tax=Lacinutrix sp. MedPE-SW TaxID=1860087 RepID=UPI000916B0AD|nr:PepSY domain-containing protein [Lacinutrix sp. MedPE-SW]OIQ17746.1 MAG: FAD-binding oxidoreductase [Lacinutrix sp. MedPE-SW]